MAYVNHSCTVFYGVMHNRTARQKSRAQLRLTVYLAYPRRLSIAPPSLQDYQLLVENLGIKQLIVQLDKLFHNFIVQKWKPAALDYLGPLHEEVLYAHLSL